MGIKEKLKFGCNVEATLTKKAIINQKMGYGFHYQIEQWRIASERSGGRFLYDEWESWNVIPDPAIDYLIGVGLDGGSTSQKSAWYVLVFDDDYTPTSDDTYNTPGFNENVDYDEGSRPLWQDGGVSEKVITNSANRAVFTFNAESALYGMGMVSANTKGDTVSGELLLSSSRFDAVKNAAATDELKVTATFTGSNV